MDAESKGSKAGESLREHALLTCLTACMLVTGATTLAAVYGLRPLCEHLLGFPAGRFSYPLLAGASVVLTSAFMARIVSRRVIARLEPARDAQGGAPDRAVETSSAAARCAREDADSRDAILRLGLEGLGETSGDAFLVVCHASGRVLAVSRRFRDWFGLVHGRERALSYSGLKEWLSESLAEGPAAAALWERLAASTARVEDESWHTKGAEPRELILSSRLLPVPDRDGSVVRLWLFRDVTERNALRRDLAEAQRMESIGRLTGGVAHDLNNMLTGVIGNLSLAELDDPPRTPRGDDSSPIESARKAGQRAAKLVRLLLGSARASPGISQPGDRVDGCLPRTPTVAACATPRGTRLHPRADQSHSGTETLLLVDDEELVRAVAESLLTRRGYTVRTAGDGREAVDRYDAARGEFDLVLLDLTMPRLSGAAAFRMLKERDAELPIILCSGYDVDLDAFESENGWRPDGSITKPYSLDDLAAEVRRVLDLRVGIAAGTG